MLVFVLCLCYKTSAPIVFYRLCFFQKGEGTESARRNGKDPSCPANTWLFPTLRALSFTVWNDSLIKVPTISFGISLNSLFGLQYQDVFLDSQPRHFSALFPPIAPSYALSHPKQFLFPPCIDTLPAHIRKGRAADTEVTRKHVFSLACRIICISDPGMMLQLGEGGERGGHLLLCRLHLTQGDA